MKPFRITFLMFMLTIFIFPNSLLAQNTEEFNLLLKPFLKAVEKSRSDLNSIKKADAKTIFQNLLAARKERTASKGNQPQISLRKNQSIRTDVSLATGSISGTVFNSDGVTPVNYTFLELYNEYGEGINYTFTTASTGNYEFTSLWPGKYLIAIENGPVTEQYYNGADDWRNAELVEVGQDAHVQNINFIRKNYSGFISGKILNNSGEPIKNCYVMLFTEENNSIASVLSDSTGFYLLGPVKAGGYKLMTEILDEQNYISQFYKNSEYFDAGETVTVKEKDTVKNINFSLKPGGLISGLLLGENGDTIKQNSCILYNRDKKTFYNNVNDQSGRFYFGGLKPGLYSIHCTNYDMNEYVAQLWYPDKTSFSEAAEIEITSTESKTGLKMVLPSGGNITGKLTYSGLFSLSRGYMDVYDKDHEYITRGIINEDGTYSIGKLGTGEYKLFFHTYVDFSANGNEPVDQWFPEASDFYNAGTVKTVAGATIPNINFSLKQGGCIIGTIYSSNNTPLPLSGTVYAVDENGTSVSSSEVDNLGIYYISKLPSGKYRLRFYYDLQDKRYLTQWYPKASDFSTAIPVTVTAPAPISNINFTLQNYGTVAGYIKDKYNQAISSEDHELNAIIYDAASGNYVKYSYPSFNGGYSVNLWEGEYKLAFFSIFYNSSGVKPDSLAVTYFPAGTSISDSLSSTIGVIADNEQKLDDIVLRKASGSISGKLIRQDSGAEYPAETYEMLVFDEYGYIASISVFSNSRSSSKKSSYKIYGLRPGKYYLGALYTVDITYQPVFQWYNLPDQQKNPNLLPRMTIDPKVAPIIVGNGDTGDINLLVTLPTGVNEKENKAVCFRLDQNFPNPFNPVTTIQYELDKAVPVSLKLFDILGREVADLVKSEQKPGLHRIGFDASSLSSGIYIYRLVAGSRSESKKCLLLK
ncbi:MAG: T9SS type A sorting domain-containing protein [Methanococcaceae archaeon]